jgi:hypothetical protein
MKPLRFWRNVSAEHAKHPQATQLVIAHSHGGNIALLAVNHLQKRDPSQLQRKETANPLVVTLATPFVEVHHADLGGLPHRIRFAVLYAFALPLWTFAKAIFPPGESFLPVLIIMVVSYFVLDFIASNWLSESGDARRQNQVERLVNATGLGEIVSSQAQRLLIIRAIDDEASLVLAIGTIGSYVTSRAIKHILGIGFFWIFIFVLLFTHLPNGRDMDVVKVVWSASFFILLGLLSVMRTAHGFELAKSPMECQISTHSTPDGKSLSEIVTLVRRTLCGR